MLGRKRNAAENALDPDEQLRQDYALACDQIDALAQEAVNKIEAYFWQTYRMRVRIGFELDGVPTNNEALSPDVALITEINRDYIKQEMPEDESVNSYDVVESNVIDREVADFEYNFLEYKIKTGALLPQKAVGAVPRAKRIMQRIARDYNFGRFQFSRFEPTFDKDATVQPLRTNISLWRASGGSKSGADPGWVNLSGEDLIRGHGTGRKALRVLETGLLFLAPRESSYVRFSGEIPSAPHYYYVKGRDQVNGESGQGVLAFAGDHDHTKRIECRLPCADARPGLTAMVVMLSVSAGMEGKVSFANQSGHQLVGNPSLGSYSAAREIASERKRAQRAFKASGRNACYAELKRICGKGVADKLFKNYRKFLAIQDAHDEMLARDVQHAMDHDIAYEDRTDPEALIRHLKALCLLTVPKPEPREGEENEDEEDPRDIAGKQLDHSLQILNPYLDATFVALGEMRRAVWELPLNERHDLSALRDIAESYGLPLVKQFDKLWDFLAEEDKLASGAEGMMNMRDMGRVQMIAQYMSHFVLEQGLGDLCENKHYAVMLGDKNIYVMKEEARAEATAYLTQFLINVMLKPRPKKAMVNMMASFETVSRLYHEIYGHVKLQEGSDTALDGMTRFLFVLHKEAERIGVFEYQDEEILTKTLGAKFRFAGKTVSADHFLEDIAPLLKKIGFGEGKK